MIMENRVTRFDEARKRIDLWWWGFGGIGNAKLEICGKNK